MFRANVWEYLLRPTGKTGSVDVTQFTVSNCWRFMGALTSFTFDVPPLWGITGFALNSMLQGSETLLHIGLSSPFGSKWCREPRQTFLVQCPNIQPLSGNSGIFKYPDTFWRRNFRQVHRLLIIDEDDSLPIAYTDLLSIALRAQAHKSFTVFNGNGFYGLIYEYPLLLHSESG